jgi:hypothetical protein
MITGLFAAFVVPVASVQAVDVLSPGCQQAPGSEACADNRGQAPGNNQIYGPNGILTKVAKLFGYVVGIISVIFIVIGGFKYVQSSGDANNVKSAKDTILYALVGLVIAGISQAIVVFVLNNIAS